MSRLDSAWRKKDEGMIEKKCWTSRPDEVKKCFYLQQIKKRREPRIKNVTINCES
jgi:hypothetical protein